MKPIPNLRKLLYPMEWCFRFIFVEMFIMILKVIYPPSLLLSVANYVAIVGIVVCLILQLFRIRDWMISSPAETPET